MRVGFVKFACWAAPAAASSQPRAAVRGMPQPGPVTWAERVAGLEQGGDAGMVLQDRAQPARERGDLHGPRRGGVSPAVDLAEHRVEDEVVQLFLAADVAVQRAGNHAEAAGEAAHAQGLRAVGGDDREGLRDDTLAGERPTAALPLVGRVEPQRERAASGC